MEHIDKSPISEAFQAAIDIGNQRLQKLGDKIIKEKIQRQILYNSKIEELSEKYIKRFNKLLLECAERVHYLEDRGPGGAGFIKKSLTFYDLFEENDFIDWDKFIDYRLQNYEKTVKIFLDEMKDADRIPSQLKNVIVEKGSKEKFIRVTVSW